MTEWPSLHYTSPRTSNRCSGLAQILEGCIPNRKKMCNGQDTWNRLLVRKQWRFGYYWRINTKSLLPETHRLSLYQQDLLRTRVLFLLLQICTLAFNVVFCASLSVFPLLHTFFSFLTEVQSSPFLTPHCTRHSFVNIHSKPRSRPLSPGTATQLPSWLSPTVLSHFPGTPLLALGHTLPGQIWREELLPFLLETSWFKQKKAIWFRDTRKKIVSIKNIKHNYFLAFYFHWLKQSSRQEICYITST